MLEVLFIFYLYTIPVVIFIWFIVSLILVISNVIKKLKVSTIKKNMLIASSVIFVGVAVPIATLVIMFLTALSHM